jgi:hypothetical protein
LTTLYLGRPLNTFKTVTKRTIALIILRVSGTLAGGSIAGVELWQAAMLAAFIGVMDVAETLSRSYVVDGELSTDEINRAFASSAEAELSAQSAASSVVVPAAAAVATYQVTQADLNSFTNDDEEDEEEEYTEK